MTGYNETYTSTDVSKIAIDILATIGVAIVGLATLIGLVLLYRFFKHGKIK